VHLLRLSRQVVLAGRGEQVGLMDKRTPPALQALVGQEGLQGLAGQVPVVQPAAQWGRVHLDLRM
jgi:hypothetical protein